jgi:hypothetical protein
VLAPTTAQKITPTTDVVPLTVQGASGGVADLLLINGQSGSNVAKVDRFGNVITPAIIAGGTGGAATVKVTAKGVASQSANLQEWQNSAASVLARLQSGGEFWSTGGLYAGTTFPSGTAQASIGVSVATKIGLMVRGFASQSADLQQWQNDTGTALAKVDSAGTLSTPAVSTAGTELKLEQTGDALGGSRIYLRNRTGINGALFENTAIDLADLAFKGNTATTTTIRHEARGVQRIYNAPELQFGTAGDPRLIVAANLGVLIRPATAATVPLVVRGFAAQTNHLQQWQDSTGTTSLAEVTPGSWLGLAATPAVPAVNRATGGYLYSEAGALKWRGSAGTVTTLAPA